jgi:EH domain-containing protein 1
VFRTVMKKYNLAPGDFPDLPDMQAKLKEFDFSKFQVIKQKYIDDAEHVMSTEFPRLMEALPRSLDSYASTAPPPNSVPVIFDAPKPPVPAFAMEDDSNPWGADEPSGKGSGSGWALSEYVPQYKPQFDTIQTNGKVSGAAAKKVLSSSGVPTTALRDIWNLSDIDSDGQLDLNEFVVAMFLIDMVKQGHSVPAALDPEMVPPGK